MRMGTGMPRTITIDRIWFLAETVTTTSVGERLRLRRLWRAVLRKR